MEGRFQVVDFNEPAQVGIFTLVLFLIVFVRYVVVSGIFFVVFYKLSGEKFLLRKINQGDWKDGQFKRELIYSAITSFVFSLSGVLMVWAWQSGFTAVYTSIGDYGYFYLLLSLGVALLLHETYYYWAHRVMHLPFLFKIVHKVHHESLISSPWTAFSFHPWESLLQAVIVPLIVWILPMHPIAIVAMLSIMTVSAVINHLDIEIYPRGFEKHWLGKWLIGATHHSLHHTEFTTNYGLYFTFWDRWMGTESGKFESLFRKKTRKPTSDAPR